MLASDKNRILITQGIMVHFLFNKPKVMLDQFKKGLETLDVLTEMRKYPDFYSKLFIAQEVSSESVIGMLSFPELSKPLLKDFFIRFVIDEEDTRRKVVIFLTGGDYIPREKKFKCALQREQNFM